jgi:hypothetical protein
MPKMTSQLLNYSTSRLISFYHAFAFAAIATFPANSNNSVTFLMRPDAIARFRAPT